MSVSSAQVQVLHAETSHYPHQSDKETGVSSRVNTNDIGRPRYSHQVLNSLSSQQQQPSESLPQSELIGKLQWLSYATVQYVSRRIHSRRSNPGRSNDSKPQRFRRPSSTFNTNFPPSFSAKSGKSTRSAVFPNAQSIIRYFKYEGLSI